MWIKGYRAWGRIFEDESAIDTSENPDPTPISPEARLLDRQNRILKWARSQKGSDGNPAVPYKWGGQNPKSSQDPAISGGGTPGFDCSGFVRWLLKSTGQFNKADGTVDNTLYSSFPGHAPGQEKKVQSVQRGDLRIGDLVFFKSDPGFNGAGHVGVVSRVDGSDFDMIHASSKKGITEDTNVQSKGWWGPIRGYGRWTNPNEKI